MEVCQSSYSETSQGETVCISVCLGIPLCVHLDLAAF